MDIRIYKNTVGKKQEKLTENNPGFKIKTQNTPP